MPGLTNYEKQVCCVKFDLRCQAWLGRTTNAPMHHKNSKPYNSSVTADVDDLDDVDLVIAVGGLGIAVFVCCCLLVCCCRGCRAGRASAAAKGDKGRTKGSEASSEESGPDQGELLMILEDVERMEPGVSQGAPTPDPALRVEAEREVERIISARGTKDMFGGGSLVQQKSEFRRLVRMLHPDKQLVSGPRATLALRLLVEAHKMLGSTRGSS